jgi:hypothetical protein
MGPTSNEPAEVLTSFATVIVTGGLTAMFTSTIEKDEGSVFTEFHLIVFDFERSRDEPLAGEVTCKAVATGADQHQLFLTMVTDAEARWG